ncbi:DUF6049 family protein [Actinotalea solisilvae]|uniref:DUF6049 family protein n=1 Tax=Actinotalea solisilvae TaxID=2072922 RepID=UPI0018F1C63E|nr:DUF6049 family protein [Actinotalea solisilvae]
MRAALVLVLAALLGAPAAAGAVVPVDAAGRPVAVVPATTEDEATDEAAPEEDPGLPLEVDVDALTSVLQPGGDLVVQGTVRNAGDDVVGTPRVVVRLARSAFLTRSSLDAWRDADDDAAAGTRLVTVDLVGPLAPGASVPFTATVPAASVGLAASAAWGPRGLAVEVVDRDDDARPRLGLARTFTIWLPEQTFSPTAVSLLVPVVGPAVDPHATAVEDGPAPLRAELETLTRPGGRLADLLVATAPYPAVSWVVDPWLVEQAHGTGAPDPGAGDGDGTGSTEDAAGTEDAGDTQDPADAAGTPGTPGTSGSPTTAATTTAAWAATLTTAAAGREVMLLPYGDTDVAALAHARGAGPWDLALRRSAESAPTAGLPADARADVVLPAEALPDLTTAAFGMRGGTRAVVTGPGALSVPDDLTYTPSARTTVTTDAGDVTVLVPDARLSSALASGAVTGAAGDTDAPRPRDPQLTPATAVQDVLAELAVVTAERPSESRHLLVTVPRDWDADPAVVAAQLAALGSVPWVRTAPVEELLAASGGDVERGTLPRTEPTAAEMPPSTLAALEGSLTLRGRLATMAERPEELVGDTTAELLAPLSVAWRADPSRRAALVAATEARTATLRDVVRVAASGVLLVSTSSRLPVLVENTLDQAVTVEITLRPGDRRLQADEPVTVTLPALGQEEVLVPVHGVQSADVEVAVEVRTADGVLVDDRARLTVRVRAEWEGIGAAIIGGLLALGLVLGVARTIRRGRTASRAAPVDSGPDALSPEEAETEGSVAGTEGTGDTTEGSVAGTDTTGAPGGERRVAAATDPPRVGAP